MAELFIAKQLLDRIRSDRPGGWWEAFQPSIVREDGGAVVLEASDLTGYTDENGSSFANAFDVLGRKTAVAITLAAGVLGTTAQSFQYDGLSRMTFARDTVNSKGSGVFVRGATTS